jgi:hypothetical protein
MNPPCLTTTSFLDLSHVAGHSTAGIAVRSHESLVLRRNLLPRVVRR